MKWLNHYRMRLVLAGVVVGVLTSALYATPPSDTCILIKVEVSGRDDVKKLAKMGLDIWEYREGDFIIRVTDDERSQIKESGFTIKTMTEDVYEYMEKIRQEQISLFADPTSAKYHSHDEVIADLIALEDSGVAKTYIIGATHEGRDIWAVKISDNPSEDENEPGALFLGCHHAREWISVEVPLYIAQYLTDNYDIDEDVKHLVDSCEIWIVPVVNPDGYEYSRANNRLWRKNRRDNGDGTFGVDLSCNYSHMWGGPGSQGNTGSNMYRGPSAFSEPESQAVRDLVLASDFRALITYHSYGQITFTPWGYTFEPCPDDISMGAMSLRVRETYKETSGAIYISWAEFPDKYLVSGGEDDWCYGEHGIYSFGIELPPITNAQGGFVLPENRITPACVENLPVALYLISFAAANDGIENLTTGKTYSNIQLAINDANDGDEIVVNPGVYHENIELIEKDLTLRSTDPNNPAIVAATVINMEDSYQGSVITLSDRRNGICELAGLTITGGQVSISCCDASPTIRNCTIASNGPNAIGFWEDCESPTIIDCTILGQVVEVDDPTLVAYWLLDETEGIVAHDRTGQHNGTLNGDPRWRPLQGQVDGALELDGIDDFISTDLVLNPADGPFSVLAWVKGGTPGQVILSQEGSLDWLMVDLVDGALSTDLRNPATTGRGALPPGPPLISQTVVTDGYWHRVGFVWDGNNRILYLDDVEVARDTAESLESADGGLYVGAGSTLEMDTFWSGLIDDVHIYNRAVKP